MCGWGAEGGSQGSRVSCQTETEPLLPLFQGQLSTLCVMISHKPLRDPKSHSSLSWCLSDVFLTHGPGGQSPKGPAGDPSGPARCSGVSLACTLLPGGWGFEERAVGSGKGRLTGRQPGFGPAYANGELRAPGSSLPFRSISFLVGKM